MPVVGQGCNSLNDGYSCNCNRDSCKGWKWGSQIVHRQIIYGIIWWFMYCNQTPTGFEYQPGHPLIWEWGKTHTHTTFYKFFFRHAASTVPHLSISVCNFCGKEPSHTLGCQSSFIPVIMFIMFITFTQDTRSFGPQNSCWQVYNLIFELEPCVTSTVLFCGHFVPTQNIIKESTN